ncbi:MAG: 7TM diverse intracellular signaling domain-containing protein [Reichenbachiella sp.]|uniref:7TM diverse intracellular signaling domain-containing protein n=1 Tax=Reichenbachiella sp. TaxID=2184521 RepID=UPI003267D354
MYYYILGKKIGPLYYYRKKVMLRLALVIYMVLQCAIELAAQSILDIVRPVETPIGLHFSHFYDPLNELDYGEVQNREFEVCESEILNFGYNIGADWLAFTFANSSNKDVSRILRINKPILDTLVLYHSSEGVVEKEMTGALVAREQEFKHSTSNYFRIQVAAQDTVKYYLKIVSMHSKQLAIYVTSDYEHAEYEQASTITIGFYLGALIIITAYSLFLGFGINDPLYLLYALSNFGSLIATLTLKGFFTGYVFNNQPELSLFFVPVNIASFSILSSFFCIRFINIREYSKLAYYMFYAVVGYGLFAILFPYVLHTVGYPSTFKMLSYATLLFTITAVVSGIVAIRHGDRNAIYYLVAWFIGWIGVVMYVLLLVGVLPINFITENLYMVGSVIEVSALSFALAKRYNNVLIDKNQLERDLLFRESDLTMVISDNKMRYQFKNALLEDLEQLKRAKPSDLIKKMNSLILDLRMQVDKEKKFDFFEDQLDHVNAEFESRLKEHYPDFTKTEIEIIYLIRLNLSNKDIAHFRNTTEGAIKSARHRIRKKLGGAVDLNELIKNI